MTNFFLTNFKGGLVFSFGDSSAPSVCGNKATGMILLMFPSLNLKRSLPGHLMVLVLIVGLFSVPVFSVSFLGF